MREKNRRGFDLDEEFLPGEARNPDPGRARQSFAEYSLEDAGDGLAFVHVALLDVDAQRADLIQRRTDGFQRGGDIGEALLELATDIAGADDVSVGIPGGLPRDVDFAPGRRRRGGGRIADRRPSR